VGQGEKFVRSRIPDALFVDVGGPSANRGFISLDRESLGASRAERITVEIASASDSDSEATLVQESDAGAVARRTVSLPRGSVVTTTIDGSFEEGSWLRLRLEPNDLFPQDDQVFVPVGSEARPGVVVFVSESGGDPFLQAAIEAADGAVDARRIEYRPREPFAAPREGDLAVFDGCDGPPESFAGRPCLLFGSPRPGLALTTTEAGGEVAVLGFSIGHPVSSGIPWDAFRVTRSSPLFVLEESETVVRSASGALVAAGERSGARFAAFAFRPMDSDLRARPALPLLVRNAIEWAVRGGAARSPSLARTGGSLDLGVPDGGDGGTLELRPLLARDASRSFSVRPKLPVPLEQTPPGLYRATWRRHHSWRLGINFLHRSETAQSRPDARFELPSIDGIRPRVTERRGAATPVAALGALLLAASFLAGFGRVLRGRR
jgi:hypothetical protein